MKMMTKTILSAITFITISEQQTTHTHREREKQRSRAEPPGRVEQNRTKRNNEE